MRALTFWRPWTDAIVHGPKRVENRGWAPPGDLLGERIAIHAGQHYDNDVAERIVPGLADGWPWPDDYVPPHEVDSPKGIVGVARVVGYLDLRTPSERIIARSVPEIPGAKVVLTNLACAADPLDERLRTLDEDPWWAGPVGWLLDDVIALSKPVRHRGWPGIWRVGGPKLEELMAALEAA